MASTNLVHVPVPRLFDPLEQTDFQRLEHAASLKGLLKAFTGKGELEAWAGRCETMRDGLIRLAQRLVGQATAYPFSLLPVMLAQQTTGSGTAFLRWRNTDRSEMGVALWERLVRHPETPLALTDELLALELQRVVLNMQISLTHTLARQARDCAEKMARADAAYRRRIDPNTVLQQE
jgi:hypothetical protein